MLKHLDLGDASPVEVRQAQSVNGPLAVLNDYYDVYVTQPDDAKWRLDNSMRFIWTICTASMYTRMYV